MKPASTHSYSIDLIVTTTGNSGNVCDLNTLKALKKARCGVQHWPL
jgi:hypothetical protein